MSALDSDISDSKEHPILNLRFHGWLDKLRMQKYLVRTRGMQADIPEAHDYIYAFGPRAYVEFPDEFLVPIHSGTWFAHQMSPTRLPLG